MSENNPHLTSRFSEIVLGQTTISNMVSKPPLISIRPHAIKFPLSGHPPSMFTTKPNNADHEGVS